LAFCDPFSTAISPLFADVPTFVSCSKPYNESRMAHQVIQLSAPCPPGESARRVCADCITRKLTSRAGVSNLQVRCDDGHARIELDYDPASVSLAQLEREARHAGSCLGPELVHMVVPIEGLYTPAAEQVIETVLNRMPGVEARASYVSRSVRIDFDRHSCPLVQIVGRAAEMGFPLRFDQAKRFPTKADADAAEVAASAKARTGTASLQGRMTSWLLGRPDVLLTLVGALFLVAGFVTGLTGGPDSLRVSLLILSYATAGWYTAVDTFQTLVALRFDIDVLMFAAAFGAAALGHYEEGALLLVLFAIGNTGEHLAMDRARHAIEALTDLTPQTATLREPDGSQREVRVEELMVGHAIVVHPFERIAADGKVAGGASSVDQSPITGESIPVEKAVGGDVFAGTINGEGQLLIAVTRLASQSTLSKIVRLVTEAQSQRSPTQTFTERVERIWVPLVLAGSVAVAVVPPLFFGGAWAVWFYRSMAVLTAASPCALAIGTPAAVLCGIARAARLGVLIKGGAHLESLGRVAAIAFDKTGTLTRGRAQVTDVVALGAISEDDVLRAAAAVEQEVSHPLAVAIVAEAQARNLEIPRAEGVEQVTGAGLVGTVEGRRVAVGRPSLLDRSLVGEAEKRIEQFNIAGRSAAMVARDGKPIGIIAMADRARENAKDSLARLKKLGVKHTIMLTGDNAHTAAAVAREVGVDEFHAALLPEQKVEAIRAATAKYGTVAMIGDGVNDAPALAAAAVGIAMGGAGTDVALETADVALMGDDLAKLPEVVGLSRFSRRVVAQNLAIALGVIALLAPSAALGYVSLGIAVVFHEGSTVVVVLNALRLLGYKPR
jgi:Cd2+/Zn2+-exporting ATPase